MQSDRFDQYSRAAGASLSDGRLSFGDFLRHLAAFLGIRRQGTDRRGDALFRGLSNRPEAVVWEDRRQYIRERTQRDIKKVAIQPRAFLQSLEPDVRAEFLSIMTAEQQKEFLSLRTSHDFFNLLSKDQRATFAVDFLGKGLKRMRSSMWAGNPANPMNQVHPASPYSSGPGHYNTFYSRKKNYFKTPSVLKVPKTVDACKIIGKLDESTCYFTYSAKPAINRDGSPCTYSPFGCGIHQPPEVNGREQTPFCPGAYAESFGCGPVSRAVRGISQCKSHTGVPLEDICNATDYHPPSVTCDSGGTTPGPSPLIGNAKFRSVVTNKTKPGCITDHYFDPVTGDRINVPVKSDGSYQPCIQQSGPGACDGVDCPCPGFFIAQTAYRSPTYGKFQMDPNQYINPLTVPFISVSIPAFNVCNLQRGQFVLVSRVYDPVSNPTEKPGDWVAGIIADVGTDNLGEISYAMYKALGIQNDNLPVTFRIYKKVFSNWPVNLADLEMKKNKYLGVCCPGRIDDQCHAFDRRGTCITDPMDPAMGSCRCTNGWLPDNEGDCTWYCPGSDGSHYVGNETASGFEECSGHGLCDYQTYNEFGDLIGQCHCESGWWGFLGSDCTFRDCVQAADWTNEEVAPCYGQGQCRQGANLNVPGTCECYDGWTNGANNDAFCTEATCYHDCSGHGVCMDNNGQPYCQCDIAHGWYGVDCSQQGCVTGNGTICSNHGFCFLDDDGVAACHCRDEWGGGVQYDPHACGRRNCPDCDVNNAKCEDYYNWLEGFCLCICGNNCEHGWECKCIDERFKPPACTNKKCCDQYPFGECNAGLKTIGGFGGGVCQDNGVCLCHDNYDPSQCCAAPLPGSAPPGFGSACFGASSRTITITCPPTMLARPCSSCSANATGGVWVLQPDGGGHFHDNAGNQYQLTESTCKMNLLSYGPSTYGGQCNKKPDPAFWITIAGSGGSSVSGLVCPTDCSDCGPGALCSVAVA